MAGQPSLKGIVGEVIGDRKNEREKAVALHDFVRDTVIFGFNPFFDAATPEETLDWELGHCNPKSRLMAALFTAAGFECYQHFVVMPKTILQDAIPDNRYWLIPDEFSHSFVEVRVEGLWCRIDSFIVDPQLWNAATPRLKREGREVGYGVCLEGTHTWDGRGDAFSQYSESLMIEDHGRVEDPESYFKNKRYRNKYMGISLNTIIKFWGERAVAPINANLDRIRRLGWVEAVD